MLPATNVVQEEQPNDACNFIDDEDGRTAPCSTAMAMYSLGFREERRYENRIKQTNK